ncbi:MAG: hypothetical protein NT094_00140 [Candidatus Staskawiczbacteria bacterium]|nr:hypothetical protein [Candidatus Staskawiczbacteria bacterium]
MIKKMENKYLLFLGFIIIFLFISSDFVHALELTYPPISSYIPPSASCTGDTCLSQFIGYWFGLLIYIAGAVALISFALGAIGLMNPSVEAHSDAKDRMKGAVLGLVLTMVSFIILQTINPIFKNTALTPLPGVYGVFLFNSATNELKPCPQSSPDTSTLPTGFTSIKYCCDKDCGAGDGTAPKLLVWIFDNTGLEIGSSNLNSGVQVQELSCSGTASIGKSFKMAFKTPGVYFCLSSGCNIYRSTANASSQNNIATPFAGNIGQVEIVNGGTGEKYGIILHQSPGIGNGGKCNIPITTEGVQAVSNSAYTFAADIFKINQTPINSGDGLTFYSEPYGWDAGADAGFVDWTKDQITSPCVASGDVGTSGCTTGQDLTFKWTDVNRPEAYRTDCSDFKKCPGSIAIRGSYLVGLYSADSYCQTFTKDVPDLNTEPVTVGGVVTNVYAAPLP